VPLRPRYVSVFPPLDPFVLLRRPAHVLPFPLQEPSARIFLQARQGLWWALKGLDVGPGDEVLAPSYHHGSEIETLIRAGARCRFYDCDTGFEPDQAELEALVGPRVRALYLTHYLGFAQDSARWRRWCDERGLLLLEDAAQAWLGRRNGEPVGGAGDLSLFCLYKVFGLPDGGAVRSRAFAGPEPDKDSVAARALAGRLADWTAQRNRFAASLFGDRRHPPHQDERPEVDFALTAVDERAARTTRSLLSRVVDPGAPGRRRANFGRLAERFGELRSDAFRVMPSESSPLVFPIEVDDKSAVADCLERHGIVDTRSWTVPHPAMDAAAYPGARRLRARLLGLPVHQELREVDLDQIVDAVMSAIDAA
jgi:dTDP-4-amino-4,6-dideoxygalactose transaminase